MPLSHVPLINKLIPSPSSTKSPLVSFVHVDSHLSVVKNVANSEAGSIQAGCHYRWWWLVVFLSCVERISAEFLLAIAGLSTAIGLALSGHKVRVFEKSPRLGQPAGGIRIPPNVTKILVEWGLEEEIRKTASLVREGSNLWDCKLFTVASHPAVILIRGSVETGRLIGYLEWAEPVIQDSGAKFYMMRVCPSHPGCDSRMKY